MKLRNKKTGEIIETLAKISFVEKQNNGLSAGKCKCFDSIGLLNEEWEDYEEPKEYWVVDYITSGVDKLMEDNEDPDVDNFNKEIGNYFETKEEAEKAVEKLKAWKRLKDKGFRINYCMKGSKWADLLGKEGRIVMAISLPEEKIKEMEADLDLLFGGKE